MIEQIFPRQYHAALKWLADKDWVRIENTGPGRVSASLNSLSVNALDAAALGPENIQALREIMRLRDISMLFNGLQVSYALKTGPKLFRPTLDQCLALENTLITVPFAEYEQPYKTVFLELPREYREQLKARYNLATAPTYVVCYKHDTGVIAISAWFSPDNVIVNIISPRADCETIEDSITLNRPPPIAGEDMPVAELVQRLGMNFSLMMTHLGVNVIGPLDPRHEKHKKQSKGKNQRKAARARKFLERAEYLIDFKQKIDFYTIHYEEADHEPREGNEGGEKRKSPKPHWRKGHWKRVRHGPGLSLTRRHFVKPVMVMLRKFQGDLGDTQTTYIGKDRK